ncbi:nitroreductase family protein [Sphaerospermopsis aphanizomenoides BCCUSP55]|uniref:nitroreductase family protein n=1 Tax=Sphaerospermopsis aphanizomenoides TaxID=459663 RepID=UPI000A74D355|nr:nitroreductase family protein [Sphaerospermopsis aphanizomenoides]MBK1989472.1 nitroreductase family protein [Sphaerospermopsis aphanizomenoides BCCUSP55]
MPHSNLSFNAYHQATKHSYLSVQMNPNYVDASTQPRAFKIYPKFYRRVKLNGNNPTHAFIKLTSAITFENIYKGEPYQLRVNPSAGALYPTEVYVQMRGVEGFLNGIYHLEIENDCLTLIYELIDDGLESYVIPNKSINGFIFLVSCVYYRSSWKYQDRSIRYCLLDSGHHLGAIAASAYLHEKNIQLIFDFDKLSLNADLGFENKEFISSCMISGEAQEKSVRRLRLSIPFVCGTDYFQAHPFLEDAYQATSVQPSHQQPLEHPQFNFDRKRFLENVWNRRSIRRFQKQSISQEIYWQILQDVQKPIPTENIEAVEIYSVVHRVEGMLPGLYIGGNLIKAGDFSEKSGYLCINQALARDGAVTLFFVSDYLSYQTAMQIAGLIGQRVYLFSNYWGIDCSGIGAFYDDEAQEFLGTNKDVLYVMAIGK